MSIFRTFDNPDDDDSGSELTEFTEDEEEHSISAKVSHEHDAGAAFGPPIPPVTRLQKRKAEEAEYGQAAEQRAQSPQTADNNGKAGRSELKAAKAVSKTVNKQWTQHTNDSKQLSKQRQRIARTKHAVWNGNIAQAKTIQQYFQKRKDLTWTSAKPDWRDCFSRPTHKKTVKHQTVLTLPTEPPEEADLQLDTNLVNIAQILRHREPLGSKPLPQGKPAVWATGRQELCETLPYYKSHHGGCYSNDGTVYSFMLDGTSQIREYMDEDVIICRAGGKMVCDSDGTTLQGKDHNINDIQPQAVLNNITHQNPLIIICGNRNTACPTEMPQRFCVLGWYKPTHVWAERVYGKHQRLFTTIRYRFERLDPSEPAWFASETRLLTEEQEQWIPALENRMCTACGTPSPGAMLSGWMCLNAGCDQFWLIPNGKSAPSITTQYHPAFLTHKTRWTNERAPFEVNPGLPDIGHQFGDNLRYINTRGIVCPQCGRCNARYLFTGWKCDTRDCGWSLTPHGTVVSPQNLHHNPWDIVSQGPALTKSTSKSIIKIDIRHTHNYKVLRYTIPGIDGCIIHAKANRTVVEENAGPNDMFMAMQTEDIGLARRMFGSEVVRSDVTRSESSNKLTVDDNTDQSTKQDGDGAQPEYLNAGRMQSFSMNFGMPYKFVAGTDSQSFDESAWPIRACRSRLNWALRTLLGETDPGKQFNELLAIGYLERQKISYHDDGEAGLGPVIASLSLGAAATMSMRVKSKYFSGVSNSGICIMESPLPLEVLQHSASSRAGRISSAQWHQRSQAFEELGTLKHAKDNQGISFFDRSKELALELGLQRRNAQALLNLHLTHGDIVVMQGEALQKYFEHAVEPHGSLRFAMTCRHILPSHLKDSDLPAYAVGLDTYAYDGSQIKQDGDAEMPEW